MKIRRIGNNETLVYVKDKEILFSYDTPVAGYINELGYFKTRKFYSNTTSKHINKYLNGMDFKLLYPEEIEELLS